MAEGVIIALVPDGSYRTSVPDPHLTLGYFGKRSEMEDWQLEIIRSVASSLTEINPSYAGPAKVAGRGVFMVDPKYNDGHSMAYVDLIDWNVLPRLRAEIENRASFSLSRGHGFQPHITVAYGNMWMPDLAKPESYGFKWRSVEVWAGDERFEYEF